MAEQPHHTASENGSREPAAKEYGQLLASLRTAVRETLAEATPDQREIGRALCRALGIRELVHAIDTLSAETRRLVANRVLIHDTFGAPGDWGYESPIGQALAAIYQLTLPEG